MLQCDISRQILAPVGGRLTSEQPSTDASMRGSTLCREAARKENLGAPSAGGWSKRPKADTGSRREIMVFSSLPGVWGGSVLARDACGGVDVWPCGVVAGYSRGRE